MTIFTLTGLSASGKTVLADFLSGRDIELKVNENNKKRLKKIGNLDRCITSTTRNPSLGEINHLDYHFYTKEEFTTKINNGEFIEYAEVYKNLYGLTKKEVETKIQNNKSIVLVMDPKGVETIKKIYKDHVVRIFIDISFDNIKKRMKINRKQEETAIKERLKDLNYFFEYRNTCDYILNGNDDINIVIDAVLDIIEENINK